MTELSMLALVVLGMSLTALIAVHFFRLGMESAEKKEIVQVHYVPVPQPPSPAFVQRLPGQEPGYVEELPDNVIYVKGWIE